MLWHDYCILVVFLYKLHLKSSNSLTRDLPYLSTKTLHVFDEQTRAVIFYENLVIHAFQCKVVEQIAVGGTQLKITDKNSRMAINDMANNRHVS